MRPRVWQAAKRAKQSDSGKACMSDRVAGVLQERLERRLVHREQMEVLDLIQVLMDGT